MQVNYYLCEQFCRINTSIIPYSKIHHKYLTQFQFVTNWPQYWCLGDRSSIPKCDCSGRFYRQRWIRTLLNLVVGPTLILASDGRGLLGKRAVFMPNTPHWSNREMGR